MFPLENDSSNSAAKHGFDAINCSNTSLALIPRLSCRDTNARSRNNFVARTPSRLLASTRWRILKNQNLQERTKWSLM